VDHDPASVEATLANALANGVDLAAERFDLLRESPAPSGDLVMANLLAPLLLSLARAGFEPPGPRVLVAGGLLAREADRVSEVLGRELGLEEEARLCEGDWAALKLAVS
jgi:ribosomal protein L11 methyltransferase